MEDTTQTMEATVSAPEASAQSELHITTAVVDKGPMPEPPKRGSAKEKMFSELRRRSGIEEEPKPKQATTKSKASVEVKTDDESDTSTTNETSNEPTDTKTTEPAATEKKAKVNPWKLVDEHKAARAKAEQEIAELRKRIPDESKSKQEQERLQAIEKRAQELEEHIKYVDYSKSKEFQEKYQKPYEDAWKRWMGELGELTVSDSNGDSRPVAPQDLLELVNMPLQKAREAAKEQFGEFADDVMSARKEIRGLFESQNEALENAKKSTTQMAAERQQKMQQHYETVRKEVDQLWTKVNTELVSDERTSKWFKPVEGDEDGNTRLQKGYALADKAFQVNPFQPNLTPEQRAEAVKIHAAVRNRAAAFGRLTVQNISLEKKVKELTDQLNKFKTSTPGSGEGTRDKQTSPQSAKDSVFGALRKIAH